MNPIVICLVFMFGAAVGGLLGFKAAGFLFDFGLRRMRVTGFQLDRVTCDCGADHPDRLALGLETVVNGKAIFAKRWTFEIAPDLQKELREKVG